MSENDSPVQGCAGEGWEALLSAMASMMAQAVRREAADDATTSVARPSTDARARLHLQHWVSVALAQEASALDQLHPALRKALVHLGTQREPGLSLHELAGVAHVSPSHLGFLFRSCLQCSFKQLLQAIRIERAKQFLLRHPYGRITEVALDAGFNDLSHFQKAFRCMTGMTPREFRSHTPSRHA